MRTRLIALACAAVGALVVLPTGSAPARPSVGPTKAQLAAVRHATERFRDVRVARRAGYMPEGPCASSPLGAMGQHYMNERLASDGRIDPLHPEALLYEKRGGRWHLNGVEYFRPDADGQLATDDDRPSVLGLAFEGPMEGHSPGMPVHYDLHAWLWKSNPRGTFSQWNPRVRC